MARLEIPAMYRLDVGSSRWGWHKMDDLRTVVGLLFERSKDGLPESLSEDATDGRPTAKALLEVYGHLNLDETFAWSDEENIDFVPIEDVPWEIDNLFVPAEWSLRVIDKVKYTINPPKLHGRELYNLTKHCLTEREQGVMELRLGIADGKEWSLKKVARLYKTRQEHIRQIEIHAESRMRRQEVVARPPLLKMS